MFIRSRILKYLLFNNYKFLRRNIHKFNVSEELISFCEKEFDLPQYKVKSIMLNWPSLQNIKEEKIIDALKSLNKIGIMKDDVIKQPKILNYHPKIIENRSNVLLECGFQKVHISLLSRSLTLMSKRTISELKNQGFIPMTINIWDHLVQCFDIWPDIQPKLTDTSNYDNMTLVDVRMKILERCLNLKYDFPQENFRRALKIYAPLKHRSLKTVSCSFFIAENLLKFPNKKIFNYGSIFVMDPENITKLILEVKEIAGVDIKTILYKHSSLLRSNYKSILAIKEIFKNENISDEAQMRCMEVYTLSPQTVQERLQEIKSNPTLKALVGNPRILSLVYYRNKVLKRMDILNSLNKKCSSLHKLVATEDEFARYAVSFGDKTRGVDVMKALKNCVDPSEFESKYKPKLVNHPFWTHIPLHGVLSTFEYLKTKFTIVEIFQNCELLLYPLEDIKSDLKDIEVLEQLGYSNIDNIINIKIDFNSISNAQRLSLLLYVLEKNHNFSGNGVWPKQISDCKIATIQ